MGHVRFAILHHHILVAPHHVRRQLLELAQAERAHNVVFVLHLFCISSWCWGLDEEWRSSKYELNIEFDSGRDELLLVSEIRVLTDKQSHSLRVVEVELPCLESGICPSWIRHLERDVLSYPSPLSRVFITSAS